MHPFGKTRPVFVGLATGVCTTIACLFVAMGVGEITNSGMLGICGPYGEHADLVGWLFISSFPIGIIAGCAVPCIVKRRFGNNPNGKRQNRVGHEDKTHH